MVAARQHHYQRLIVDLTMLFILSGHPRHFSEDKVQDEQRHNGIQLIYVCKCYSWIRLYCSPVSRICYLIG